MNKENDATEIDVVRLYSLYIISPRLFPVNRKHKKEKNEEGEKNKMKKV